jgi:hypothetical protein
MRRRTLALALLLAALPAPALAQGAPSVTAGGGTYLETYDFLDPTLIGVRRISLLSVPLAARSALVGNTAVELRGAFGRAWMERVDGTEVSLAGLTDTELRLSAAPLGDRVLLSAGVLLPTGNSSHAPEQADLAGMIAADLLPFRMSNWGSGGGAGLVSSFAAPVGDFGVGVSVGYTVGREFEPIRDGQLAYRPGDELRLRLAIDRTIGSSAKGSVVLGMQRYRDDRFAGETVFEPGNRVEAVGSLAFAVGDVSNGLAYAGIQHRGAGRLTVPDVVTPAQSLLLTGIAARVPRGGATFVPGVDVRLFRREDGIGQGHLTSVGAAFEIPAGGVVVIPTLRGRFGQALLWEGAETSVRGAELGLGLRVRR